MNEYLFAIISTVIGSGVTWFFARRKNTAEAQGSEIDNVEKVIKIYRESLENITVELTARINKQSTIIIEQAHEIELLKVEISKLKDKRRC
jgi:hypothetical protein